MCFSVPPTYRTWLLQEAAGLQYRRLADEQGSKLCELRLRS